MAGNKYKLCIGSFDLIKGFAICVVIFGHIATLFNVNKLTWFYPLLAVLEYLKTPIIPLFFIISGYGFFEKDLGAVLKKSARNLLIPYAVAMVLFCTLQPTVAILQGTELRDAIRKGLSILLAFLLGLPIPGKMLFGIRLSHCAIVWYLLSLFWAHNIVNVILKVKHTWVQPVVVIICAALGYWLFQLDMTYYCLPHGLIATSYVYLGYIIKKYRVIQKCGAIQRRFPAWIICTLWIVVAVLYADWGEFDLCYGKFTWFPGDYIGVAVLALLLLYAGIYLDQFDGAVLDCFRRIGVYSYWVFCIHSVEQKCLPWDKFIQLTANVPNVGFVSSLLIKVIIITVFCKIIKKVKKRNYRKKVNYEESKLCSGTH